MTERYMRAYYHEFTPTGCDAVDRVLEAIARAGKAYHNTSEWSEPIEDGGDACYWDAIQTAADAAANQSICGWNSDDDGTYHTGCGQVFCLNEGTPRENTMRFCCYCGGTLRQGRLYPPSARAERRNPEGKES